MKSIGYEARELAASDLGSVITALAFATRKHRDQRRKDVHASPYINHPIALAEVLVNEAGITDIQVICAALLHDTVEDTETTPEEIEDAFGRPVRDIVMEVTDDQTLDKAQRKQRQIDHAAQLSDQAKLVKLADKICNLRDVSATPPADWSVPRCQAYFDWAKAVIDNLRGVHGILEEAFDAACAKRPG